MGNKRVTKKTVYREDAAHMTFNDKFRELARKEQDLTKEIVSKDAEINRLYTKIKDHSDLNAEIIDLKNQVKILKQELKERVDLNRSKAKKEPKQEAKNIEKIKNQSTIEQTPTPNIQRDGLVSIIIPSYNSRDYICGAVDSVLNQTYDNIEILIIDDNSQDDTLEVLKKYLDNPKVNIYKSPVNVGPYVLKNYMLDKIKGKYFTILDSDDIDVPTKIEKQVAEFKKNSKIKCVTCSYFRYGAASATLGWPAMMYKKEVFDKIGYYDSVRFGADSEFYHRFISVWGKNCTKHIDLVLSKGPRRSDGITGIIPQGSKHRIEYQKRYRQWHGTGSNLWMSSDPKKRPFEVSKIMLNDYIPSPSKITKITKISNNIRDKVFVGIAAIPTRVNSFKKTIESLIHQVDEIGVYLNGWNKIPDFLKHPKIKIQQSQLTGDIGDAGKFFWIDNYSGYYFTCDDDIVYPQDYIQRTINKIEDYKRKAVIGFHGSVLLPNFQHYYDVKSRNVLSFNFDRKKDEHVHILGTGTIGFHTSTIQVKLSDFKKPNMADIFFGKLGQEQEVPFIVQKHLKGEMYSIESGESISDSGIKRKGSRLDTSSDQNKLVKEVNWKINQYSEVKRGLNILMIGRFETYTKGGIYRSNHMLKEYLTKLGNQVYSIDSMAKQYTIPADIDICLVYPGDTSRPDFKKAEEKMIEASRMGVKCCINMSYNNEDSRTLDIERHIEKYIGMGLSIHMMIFAEGTRMDPILVKYRDLMIKFPKTIRLPKLKSPIPEYSEREGIVLGDVAKLENRKIINGSAQEWIDAIKKELPTVKIYAYQQYGKKTNLTGLELVPYMSNGFSDWLAQRRISVCLNQKLSFEMLPVESQSFGTPAVYRDMPQSLNEWIGHTGICSNSPEEMASLIHELYNNPVMWNNYSRLGIHNSQRNSIEAAAVTLYSAIRELVQK